MSGECDCLVEAEWRGRGDLQLVHGRVVQRDVQREKECDQRGGEEGGGRAWPAVCVRGAPHHPPHTSNCNNNNSDGDKPADDRYNSGK